MGYNGDKRVGTEGRESGSSSPTAAQAHQVPASGIRPLCTLSPGQQVKLKQVVPLTEEEKTEHGVAAERRRMRLVYTDTIKDLLAHYAIQDGMWVRGQPGVRRGKLVSSHPL